MKWYLGGVFIFGFLFGLVDQLATGGLYKVPAIMIGKALAPAIIFLLIATLIVRPWKRRDPGKDTPPPYVGSSLTIGVLVAIMLLGSMS
jgi:hypothetical protein